MFFSQAMMKKMLVQRIDVFDSRIEEFKPSQKIKWTEK